MVWSGPRRACLGVAVALLVGAGLVGIDAGSSPGSAFAGSRQPAEAVDVAGLSLGPVAVVRVRGLLDGETASLQRPPDAPARGLHLGFAGLLFAGGVVSAYLLWWGLRRADWRAASPLGRSWLAALRAPPAVAA